MMTVAPRGKRCDLGWLRDHCYLPGEEEERGPLSSWKVFDVEPAQERLPPAIHIRRCGAVIGAHSNTDFGSRSPGSGSDGRLAGPTHSGMCRCGPGGPPLLVAGRADRDRHKHAIRDVVLSDSGFPAGRIDVRLEERVHAGAQRRDGLLGEPRVARLPTEVQW